jgi:hypothetical protein
MPTPPRLFPYRNQMLSVKAIAAIRGLEESTIRWRLRNGVDIDAPNHGGKGLDESGEFEIGSNADKLFWEDDLEARVWHLHCGGDDFGECTLQEIAELWGMSRERVRQIEESAMRKIRVKAARGCPDAIACKLLLEERIEQMSRRRPDHWEWMEMQSPGHIELAAWEKSHSHSVVAALSGRGSDIYKDRLEAAKRGNNAMRGRTRRKATS